MTLHTVLRQYLEAARVLTHTEVKLALSGQLHHKDYVPQAWRTLPQAPQQALIACLLRTCKALYHERELAGRTDLPVDVVSTRGA